MRQNSALREVNTFIFKIIFIRVQLIYNAVLVSAIQRNESVTHILMSTLFNLLPYGSLQHIEQSFLCYTVGSYQLSILYIVACLFQSPSPNLSHPSFPHSNHITTYLWLYFCFVNRFICTIILASLCKQYHMMLIFLWQKKIPDGERYQTSISMTISRSIHVAANSIISFFFMAE